MIIGWPISCFVYQWRQFTTSRDSNVDYVHGVIFKICSLWTPLTTWDSLPPFIGKRAIDLQLKGFLVFACHCHFTSLTGLVVGHFFIRFSRCRSGCQRTKQGDVMDAASRRDVPGARTRKASFTLKTQPQQPKGKAKTKLFLWCLSFILWSFLLVLWFFFCKPFSPINGPNNRNIDGNIGLNSVTRKRLFERLPLW